MKTSAAIREYLIEIEVRSIPRRPFAGIGIASISLRFCEQEAHIQEVEEINLAVVRHSARL